MEKLCELLHETVHQTFFKICIMTTRKLFLAMEIFKMLPRINITIASVSFSMYDSVDFKNKTRLHILDGSSPEDTLLDKI